MLVLVVVLGFLMVSTFRYRSFKGVDLRRRRSYMTVLGDGAALPAVAAHPEASLLAVTSLYTVSGPARLGVGGAAPARAAARRSPRGAASPRREAGGARRRRRRRRGARRAGAARSGVASRRSTAAGWSPAEPSSSERRSRRLSCARCGRRRASTSSRSRCWRSSTASSARAPASSYHYVIVDYLCRWLSGEASGGLGRARRGVGGPGGAWPAYDLPPKAARGGRGRAPEGGLGLDRGARRLACRARDAYARFRRDGRGGGDMMRRSASSSPGSSLSRSPAWSRPRTPGASAFPRRSPSSRRSAPRPARATSSGRSRPSPSRRGAACCGRTPPSTRATTSARRRPSGSGRARPTACRVACADLRGLARNGRRPAPASEPVEHPVDDDAGHRHVQPER